jgi:TPP-dependent pyruvate/acetoin dehydrogenase alpha subunit
VSESEVSEVGLVAPEPGRKNAMDLYRTMAFIRRFEEVSQALFRRGQITGSIHLGMGQEAVATGICDVLDERDLVAATYRGHAAALALGVDPMQFMAELLGRRVGTCGGRAGSMNIIDLRHRLIGCFGIVGGSIAAATGAALTLQRRAAGIAVAFFGDGAVNQGYFHECLNFASVNQLPVIYVCENNLYSEFTPMSAVTAGSIVNRASAFDLPTSQIDGNDVWAVRQAALDAVEYVRGGNGPIFLEALTYRLNDHARGDPVEYRPEGEMDAWRLRDPLTLAAKRLSSDYGVSEAEITDILRDVGEQVDRVRELAIEQPFPEPSDMGSEFKITLGDSSE